ncbi:MAG: bifunctional phosphoribosyl-AMP cyclohydrolase/phosphoribosyl-ATP diphosphatase HisIE [Pseudomonadota bacterium]
MSLIGNNPRAASADGIDWAKGDGLVPAVVQDASSGRILMLGYMSEAAFEHTRATGAVTFFSRSRQTLWTKGETSGNTLKLVDIATDCDADTLVVLAHPTGPTCHLGYTSCFDAAPGEAAGADAMLPALDALIAERATQAPEGSYVAKLLAEGPKRCAQKVGEEGVEVAIAGVSEDDNALLNETADLFFHALVLLRSRGLGLADVERVLAARRA